MSSTIDSPIDRPIDTAAASAAQAGLPTGELRDTWLRERVTAVLSSLVSVLGAVAAVVVIWLGFIKAYDIDPLVAKSPLDVARYLVDGGDQFSKSTEIWTALGQTLVDAGVGYVAGLAAAIAVALLFVLSRGVESAFMPIAVTVRSVPLVAMTPLLTLIFGRGLLGTTVISGIVVFFPALVTVAFGLKSTPRQAADLVRAYGGSGWAIARKVMIPSALPAVFASARVAVPGALVGAMLAEWLATGKGIGYLMLSNTQNFNYGQLWASVTVLTFLSVLLYYAVGVLEALVLARFGPPRS